MNKAVKIILAIAIGILFPVLSFLLVLTVFPDHKAANITYPEYPSYADCRSSTGTSKTQNYDYGCEDRVRRQYDDEVKKYENSKSVVAQDASAVTANRVKLALVIVIVGFLIALVARPISPVSAGFAIGSTILLAFCAGYAVGGNTIDLVSELLFLFVFVELVVLMFVVDLVFKPIPYVDPVADKPNEPKGKTT